MCVDYRMITINCTIIINNKSTTIERNQYGNVNNFDADPSRPPVFINIQYHSDPSPVTILFKKIERDRDCSKAVYEAHEKNIPEDLYRSITNVAITERCLPGIVSRNAY